MNRRNVLGNQMESSKSMWIVLTGILVSVLQFGIYYFVSDGWLGLVLVGLCFLLGGVAVHFVTGEIEELFSYLLIPCVFSGSVALLLPHMETTVLPESKVVYIGCLLAWLIPVLYASIFTWAEGTSALGQFAGFYRKAAVLFYLVYAGVFIYWITVRVRVPEENVTVQMIPFATFAAYVDGIITKTVSLERLLLFLAERIFLFLPYGFFIAMVGRKLHSLLRLSLVLLLPVLVELLQYLLRIGNCDVDDAVFSFLGALIGMLSFVVFNLLFQSTTGKNFDGTEIEKDYYGRRI